jgi:hypothetical protein
VKNGTTRLRYKLSTVCRGGTFSEQQLRYIERHNAFYFLFLSFFLCRRATVSSAAYACITVSPVGIDISGWVFVLQILESTC